MSDWHKIPNVRDRLSWREDKGRLKLRFFVSIIMVGMVLNGYDGTLISGLQAFDTWRADLGEPSATRIGLLNACSQFSGLVVGPIIQQIDDRFGRKWGIRFYSYSLLIGSVIGCIAGVAGANGYALFICGRTIIGFGLASFLMTSLVVIHEITHPRTRSTIAHSWNSYWILGAVIASWVNYGCSYMTTSWQWRLPYIIQIVPAAYLLIAIQFVPETPRFMISKGREEEAFQFLADYHGNGDVNDPLVVFEFHEMKAAIEHEKEAKAEKWKTILRVRSNQHRLSLAALMMFCVSLSGSSIIYYYYTIVFSLVGITNPSTQTGIAAGLNMFTWVTQIAGVIWGRYAGRRTIMLILWPCILVGLAGMCAGTAVYTNSPDGNRAAGIACVAMVWMYLGTFNAANPILWAYPSEVQTFSMRSKGLLVWNTVSQLFGGYTSWVDPVALEKLGYKYYFVYMPLIVIQWFLMYFFMVETKGYTLEEIAIAFDGSSTNLIDDAGTTPLSDLEADRRSIVSDYKAQESPEKVRDLESGKTPAES